MTVRILVVEDDPSLTALVTYNLMAAGYEAASAADAEEALLLLDESRFDMVVLDWMLPDMTGLELCTRLRRSGRQRDLPILMLTARGEEADLVRGLTSGADDYVVKPFSVPELMARIKALLRRAAPERVGEVLEAGDVKLDRATRRVSRGGREIALGPTEYRLLESMLESAGRVLTRPQLLDRVWGNAAEIDERTVDVHVGRLRKALMQGGESDPIRTVRGAGYAIEPATGSSR
jgi:two-component system phosphate regulon response regulator PhoB